MLDVNSLLSQLGLSGATLLVCSIVLFLVIQIVLKLDYFHQYYKTKEFTHINNLISIKDSLSNEDLKALNQEVVDEYSFRQCTNISANKKLRNFIIASYKEHDIELYHFKRASRFFKLTDSGIEIKISKLDYFGKYFNYFFSALLFILLLSVMALFVTEKDINFEEFLILLFSSCLLGLSSIYVLTQNFPLKSAIYLKEKLHI